MSSKKVLLTGGSGFLGSFVQDKLRERDWCSEIIIPRSVDYNLVQEGDVIRMYEEHKPDIVIHLAAAVGGIGANKDHPGKFFYDNLMMGVQTMHYAMKSGVEKFVAIGTVCAYPKNTPVPFLEENIWDGYPEETNAPYGLAKKMMLVQAQAYRQEYDFNVIYLLPVNLYGPKDNFDLETSHVVPAIIRKCDMAKEKGESFVTLWGDGSPTREFFYVEDAAEGIVLATEKYNGSDPVNLGCGAETSIHNLAELIAKEIGFEGEIIWDTSKPNGQPRRCMDVSKANKLFDFEAQVGLEEGLKKTVQWYRDNRHDLREVYFD